MIKVFKNTVLLVFLVATFSCVKDNDVLPAPQNIITYDTSSVTGSLLVKVFFYKNASVYQAGSGADVRLYVSYEDMMNDIFLYDLPTTSGGTVNFGYLIYGNYYVRSRQMIEGLPHDGIGVVQVRPRRNEVLNVTMYPL